MSFYQNLFEDEFRGNWVLGDRQYALTFSIGANRNKNDYMLSWANEPYDFSASGIFTINYAFDVNYVYYSTLSIDVTGSTPSATLASEVVSALNANPTFSELWVAQVQSNPQSVKPTNWTTTVMPTNAVLITRNPRRAKQTIRSFISNTGAELSLHFNQNAPIAELPTYFNRHTIANRLNYPDSTGSLLLLSHNITAISVANPTHVTATAHGFSSGDTVHIFGSNSTPTINGTRTVTVLDANNFTVPVNVTTAGTEGYVLSDTEFNLVVAAGMTPSAMQADWQLLKGRGSGLFNFQNITVDGSNRITQIIEYPAGAVAGDFGRKIQYAYSGGNTQPSQITEIPYTLASGDLVTPP